MPKRIRPSTFLPGLLLTALRHKPAMAGHFPLDWIRNVMYNIAGRRASYADEL